MLYGDYLVRISDAAIAEAENGLFYVEPAYKVILINAGLWPDTVTDQELSWSDVKEYLELEVTALNREHDKTPEVIAWIHNIITSTLDPTMLEYENEVAQKLIETLREKSNQKPSKRPSKKK